MTFDGSWAWTSDSSGNEMLRSDERDYFFIPMGDEVGLFTACCTSPLTLYPYNALEEYELEFEFEDKSRDWICGSCKKVFFSLPPGVSVEAPWKYLTKWLTFLVNASGTNELMAEIEVSCLEDLLREKQGA